MLVRLGQSVNAGDPLVRVFAAGETRRAAAMISAAIQIEDASQIKDSSCEPPRLILERISYDEPQ